MEEDTIEIRMQPVETSSGEDNDTQDKGPIDYNDLLSSAGGFGRYQLILFISTFPFYIFGGFVYFGQLFITQVSPNHWCWIPELQNLTDVERRNLAIPPDNHGKFGYSRCYTYDANWTEVLLSADKPNQTWNTIPCQHGWEFNKTEIPYSTISSEMGWVCDKDTYPATGQSIFFAGSVVGGVLFGWVADRFGRLPALILSNLVACIAGVASTFVNNIVEFAICRFIYGTSCDNLITMAYLIVLEYVTPKYRPKVANLPFALFYAPILIALPWIALACGHWKTFNLATNVPIGLALLSPLLIPESPRWLLSNGRIDKVVERVLTVAKTNRKTLSSTVVKRFKQTMSAKKQEISVNILHLLKRPLLRKAYICMCLVYISAVLIFDALVRIIEHLKFDFFISFSLISLSELPSLVINAFILDWLGRRRMITITMSICCVFSILIAFVGGGTPSLVCAIVARFVINIGLGTAGQWTAEVLPTPVRGTGMSLQHILGFLVAILSPYIVYLERYVYWFPLVVVGSVAGFSAILAQMLPETAGKDLPQTLEDSEDLVMSQKMLNVLCSKGKKMKKGECEGKENEGYA